MQSDRFLAGLAEQANHYDPNNIAFFNVNAGTDLKQDLSFYGGSVIVDNNTSKYLHFPDAGDGVNGRYVPPGLPAQFPLLKPSRIARALWAAPGGKVQGPTVAGEQAQLTYYAAKIPPASGVAQPVPGVQGTLTTAFPSLSRAIGTYSFDVPEQHFARGIAVFLVVTAGAGNVTLSIIEQETVTTYSVNLLSSVAVASGASTALKVYPGIAVVANQTQNTCISHIPRLSAVVAANTATFAVAYTLLP